MIINKKESKFFSKEIDRFLRKRKLLLRDYEELIESIAKNDEIGDVVPGAGGMRKIRLKSATGGKRGGFRVHYFFDKRNRGLYLTDIFAKNEKEDISEAQKKIFKELIHAIKNQET